MVKDCSIYQSFRLRRCTIAASVLSRMKSWKIRAAPWGWHRLSGEQLYSWEEGRCGRRCCSGLSTCNFILWLILNSYAVVVHLHTPLIIVIKCIHQEQSKLDLETWPCGYGNLKVMGSNPIGFSTYIYCKVCSIVCGDQK